MVLLRNSLVKHWRKLLVAILLVVSFSGATAAAADKPGITVSPGQLNFTLSKDATQQTIPVTITNSYDSPVTLDAQFKGIDENAGLLIPTDNIEKTFADSLRISETAITLAPHENHIVQVQVSNLAVLGPGGHYATLLLTQEATGDSQVSLKSAISLSLFAVKVAGAQQKLTLTGIHTNGWLFRLPTSASLSFRNDGNVLAVPRGVVEVLDSRYGILAKGIANPQSLPLLPGKALTSQVQIAGLTSTWKPQKLLIWTAYRPDGALNQTVVRRTIWYVPPFYPVLLLVNILIIWLTRSRWQPRLRLRSRFAVLSRLPSLSKHTQPSPQIDPGEVAATPAAIVIAESVEKVVLGAPELPTAFKKAGPAPNSAKAKSKTKAPTKQANKAASKKPTQKIVVTDPKPEKPLLTLASLQQRTTRVEPKPKSAPKNAKKTTKKPKKPVSAKNKPKSSA